MPDAAARPPQQLPGSESDYAPLAPAAVAAAAFAALFAVLLVVIAAMAVLQGKPLQEPWLLVFPALTMVLAFIARRQIRASEGARTGEYWANVAWTVAVVGGALLIAYLLAIQFAVRREATAAFTAFAQPMAESNPSNPSDPKLAEAAFYTLSPGQQSLVGKPGNLAVMQSTHKDAILRLGATDLGRLVARNAGAVTIAPGSLVKWEQKGPGVESVMAGIVTTPEGEVAIAVPLLGQSLEGEPRRWLVSKPPNGSFFAAGGRRSTAYGWGVELVEQSAKQSLTNLLRVLSQPGLVEVFYEGYVLPNGDPKGAAEQLAARIGATLPRAALVGVVGVVPAPKPGMDEAIDRLFFDADGNQRSGAERDQFKSLLLTPGRLAPAGSRNKDNPDVLPLVRVSGTAVEVAVPIEIVLSAEGVQPPVARGLAVMRVADPRGAEVAAELAAMKAAGNAFLATPPAEMVEKWRNLPWQLVRLESDLRPMQVAQPLERAGGPGGAMMGQ